MIYGCGWKNDILIEIVGKHYKGQISRKKRKCIRKYSIIVNTKYAPSYGSALCHGKGITVF